MSSKKGTKCRTSFSSSTHCSITSVKSRWQISSTRYILGHIPGPESRNHSFWHSKTCSPLSHPQRPHAFYVFFLFFFFWRRRDCSPDKPTCRWIGSKITMKGIFDKSAFLRNTINIEWCLQSELPSKKVCSQNCHSYFFHTMINFRFSLSSHHCKLRRQRLYRQTSSAFGDFALKHSLHLMAINHATITITTRWVTVLLFIIFQWEMQEIRT